MSKPQIEMAKPAAHQKLTEKKKKKKKLTEHLGNREGCMREAPGSNRGEGFSAGDLHRRLSTLDFHSPEVKTLPQKFFPQQCLQSFTKAKSFTFYIPGVPRLLLSLLCVLSHVRLFVTHKLYPARLLCPWDSIGKNPGVGCHFLLQGIFPTQGSNPRRLHFRLILYYLRHWKERANA